MSTLSRREPILIMVNSNHEFPLKYLENPLLAKETLLAIHGDRSDIQLTYDSYYAFATTIRQMHILLADAKICSLRTRPIFLYYALIHLAKATMIVNDPSKSPQTHTQKHGVSIKSKKIMVNAYLDEIIRVEQQGTLSSWYQALHDLINKRLNQRSEKVFSNEEFTPKNMDISIENNHRNREFTGLQFRIYDLWSMIPESDLYQRTGLVPQRLHENTYPLSEQIDCFHLPRKQLGKWNLTMQQFKQWMTQYDPKKLITSIDADESIITIDFVTSRQTSFPTISLYLPLFNLRLPSRSTIIDRLETKKLILGGPQLPWPAVLNHYLPEPMIHFMLLFHLSMLSRYYPLEWNDLIADDTSIDYLSIEKLCSQTERTILQFGCAWLT